MGFTVQRIGTMIQSQGGQGGLTLVGRLTAFTIPLTNAQVKVGGYGRKRKRSFMQNVSAAGNIWINSEDVNQVGVKVPAGGSFSDDPPFPHQGPWFISTDTAGSTVIVGFYE